MQSPLFSLLDSVSFIQSPSFSLRHSVSFSPYNSVSVIQAVTSTITPGEFTEFQTTMGVIGRVKRAQHMGFDSVLMPEGVSQM
jgi:hypothetical protein